ncbi:putative F-box/LRR-repeat protein At4g15060 [Euphorbia lathyris]|uniref:putative F-box/LRR-repeat protein At4g15060 n=1 Tax=Euphorbia lathyris TaxID=212925 RepID=UPI003313C7D3
MDLDEDFDEQEEEEGGGGGGEDMTVSEIDEFSNPSMDSDSQVRVKHQNKEVHDAQPNQFNLKTQRTEDGVDFISKLPDELLHEILSYASLRDVVRTSILSSRWRYISAYKPFLRFSWNEMFTNWNLNAKGKPCMVFEKKIRRAVNDYIRFYRGDKIHSFKFCFCSNKSICFRDLGYDGFDGAADVDGWIKFALNKCVESLTLFADCPFDCCKNHCFLPRNFVFEYIFRIELFDGMTISLKHLKLKCCELGPNFTNQFSSLETLSLDNVNCLARNLESMLPFLGNLKTLEISNSILPKKLSLVSLPLLRKFLAYRTKSLEEIELSSPYLVELKCLDGRGNPEDLAYYIKWPVKCNFSGAPKLTSLSYMVPIAEMDVMFTDISRQNPELRNLTVVILNDWFKWTPTRNVWTLSQVTHLNLRVFKSSYFSFARAMAILKAFPNLRVFRLIMHCKEDLKEETEEEHDLSYVPEYLEDFSFSYFHCSKLQMQFAEYLLKYASALEKMSILIDPKGSQYPFYKGRYRGMTYWSVANTLREFDKRNILDVQTSEEIIFGSISR